MTTRAIIHIDTIMLCRHADGYPECCGEIIKSVLPHPDEYWDCEEIATRLVRYGEYRDFMCAEGAHGDEEYKYIVDCKAKKMTVAKVGWVHDGKLSRAILTPIQVTSYDDGEPAVITVVQQDED